MTGPVQAGEGRLQITASAQSIGDDWMICVSGGEKPHVGACALAVFEPAQNSSCAVSVMTVQGHRDDLPAKKLALLACETLQCAVSLTVGIHIDHASAAEITQLLDNAAAAMNLLLEQIQHRPPHLRR